MIWFVLLVVLNVADAVTTIVGLKRGATEANPVMRALFARVGPAPALIAWKGAFLGAMFYFLQMIDERALMVLCAFYSGVVAWNVLQLKRKV